MGVFPMSPATPSQITLEFSDLGRAMNLSMLSPMEDRRRDLLCVLFDVDRLVLPVVARIMAVVERVKKMPSAAPMAMCLFFSVSDSSMAFFFWSVCGGE